MARNADEIGSVHRGEAEAARIGKEVSRCAKVSPDHLVGDRLRCVGWRRNQHRGAEDERGQDIRNATDISAIQIQQLNGSVTAHALAGLLLAGAATIPLLIMGVNALVGRAETSNDWRSEATEE